MSSADDRRSQSGRWESMTTAKLRNRSHEWRRIQACPATEKKADGTILAAGEGANQLFSWMPKTVLNDRTGYSLGVVSSLLWAMLRPGRRDKTATRMRPTPWQRMWTSSALDFSGEVRREGRDSRRHAISETSARSVSPSRGNASPSCAAHGCFTRLPHARAVALRQPFLRPPEALADENSHE